MTGPRLDPSPRVLVAEDEDATRRALRQLLASEGYRVTAVADGRTALESIERERFDLALLDISMPGLSGWQVAERVRARGSRRPALVALTSRDRRRDRERSREAGFSAHLAKPVGLSQLLAIVARLAGR